MDRRNKKLGGGGARRRTACAALAVALVLTACKAAPHPDPAHNADVPPQATGSAIRPDRSDASGRYFAAQLHLHAHLSEGRGSMRGHNAEAQALGNIDVIWWTDHDWRVVGHTCLSEYGFEAQRSTIEIPRRNVSWRKDRPRFVSYGFTPVVAGAKLRSHRAELARDGAFEGAASLLLAAESEAGADTWGWSEARMFASGGRLMASLSADVVLHLAVRARGRCTENRRVAVRLSLSRQPEGLVELWYLLGEEGNRRVVATAEGKVGIVPVALTPRDWSHLSLPVTDDAIDLDLGGWDNSLHAIRLGVAARLGDKAEARFDSLRIATETGGREVMHKQEEMAKQLENESGLVNLVGSELSYSQHFCAYLPQPDLPDFERFPNGMEQRSLVRWVHERGGVISYAHIFGTSSGALSGDALKRRNSRWRARAVNNQVFGADLLEVGYPLRVEPLPAHLEVWDALSADRVFITAVGTSDSHDQNTGWTNGNNFVSWIWARSPQAEDLIEGLRLGRVFFGDPAGFKGRLDLATADGIPMGSVVVTEREFHEVRVQATDLPAGCVLRWVVDGQVEREDSPPAGDVESTLKVATAAYRFVRVEVWRGGAGLVFSNCLYFVPAAHAEGIPDLRLVHAGGGS